METPFNLQLSRETYAIHSARFQAFFMISELKKMFFQSFSKLNLSLS